MTESPPLRVKATKLVVARETREERERERERERPFEGLHVPSCSWRGGEKRLVVKEGGGRRGGARAGGLHFV